VLLNNSDFLRIILWRAVATQRTASYRCHIHGNEYRNLSNDTQQLGEILLPRQPICTDMSFSGNQPRIMHFVRVKVGDHYSVSPEATLGPTVREFSSEWAERLQEWDTRLRVSEWAKTSREISEKLRGDKLESKKIASQRIQEFESRQFEGSRVDGSRVREFESSSSTVV
jgi:hypothetical protein